ncbi:nuclear pore complex protein NUP85 isoform X1 [Elaeis guineensis]|uniref:Nuclear pore complex protein Nup85 n=1 Tax=Elaeis guineensis var. tenera TaxID=51953 RepID=A0A6I9RD70_ELAGV|nr:nuclear pore complex protein NUP85 isoform X1 [Elaeis guineensis]
MPGLASDPGDSLVPFLPDVRDPVVYPVRHGVNPPIFRVYVSWTRGNFLQVACLRPPAAEPAGGEEDGVSDEEIGGKVVEVKLGAGDEEISEAQRRRIAYGSVPAFALLQSRKNSLAAMSRMSASSIRTEWWEHVLEYSRHISDLLGNPMLPSSTVIEDPKMIMQPHEEPTTLKAAWQLMEIFYVDKLSSTWLPERLVDWLADYDSLLTETTIHSKVEGLQKRLSSLKVVVEDDPEYWEGMSGALAAGWLDAVVKLLRLHGSYQLEQLGSRETENGLVEAVAVLVSTMPRMRPHLPAGRLGQCYKTKPDFIKAWEKWRLHISRLDSSTFWVQCSHHQTREGLRNLLQIMLGNISNLRAATCHWMELFISHFLYIRPLTMGLDEFHSLAQKCMQLKSSSSSNGLMGLFIGILGENPEVVLAECSKTLGPWMVAHAMELLTVDNGHADILLHEERYSLGDISIEELHRLVYAQVLSSHPLTWQIAPTYLASCPKQGLGLLEILLYKQPVQHYQMILKNLEICRLYELENISSSIMKIAGTYHWKHGRKGSGVYWLQQARDEVRLNKIAQQLFECIGKSISDDSFKQWEGLIELLGSQVGTAGGLEFLHKYRDFKRSLQQVQDGSPVDAARQTMESLMQLMKNSSTPQRFWLPLLHDSVKLLNWKAQPLLTVSETNLLLNKLQELSMVKLHPDFCESNLPPQALSSVRLALATNLGRAVLEEC